MSVNKYCVCQLAPCLSTCYFCQLKLCLSFCNFVSVILHCVCRLALCLSFSILCLPTCIVSVNLHCVCQLVIVSVNIHLHMSRSDFLGKTVCCSFLFRKHFRNIDYHHRKEQDCCTCAVGHIDHYHMSSCTCSMIPRFPSFHV